MVVSNAGHDTELGLAPGRDGALRRLFAVLASLFLASLLLASLLLASLLLSGRLEAVVVLLLCALLASRAVCTGRDGAREGSDVCSGKRELQAAWVCKAWQPPHTQPALTDTHHIHC